MEAVREIQSFAEHQALVLLGTIWMRYPSLCLSVAKLRLKMRLWNRATPDNHCNYRQHAATGFENHCFSEKCLFLCTVIQMNLCSFRRVNDGGKVHKIDHTSERLDVHTLERVYVQMKWQTD